MEGRDLQLTRREAEILRLLSDGLDLKMISDKLVVSGLTVSLHLDGIWGKLCRQRNEGALPGFSQTVEVQKNGHVEATVPELKEGELVELTLSPTRPKRAFGSLKGKIRIHDNFDDPLEEFAPYL